MDLLVMRESKELLMISAKAPPIQLERSDDKESNRNLNSTVAEPSVMTPSMAQIALCEQFIQLVRRYITDYDSVKKYRTEVEVYRQDMEVSDHYSKKELETRASVLKMRELVVDEATILLKRLYAQLLSVKSKLMKSISCKVVLQPSLNEKGQEVPLTITISTTSGDGLGSTGASTVDRHQFENVKRTSSLTKPSNSTYNIHCSRAKMLFIHTDLDTVRPGYETIFSIMKWVFSHENAPRVQFSGAIDVSLFSLTFCFPLLSFLNFLFTLY
jgi:hypothetical protein